MTVNANRQRAIPLANRQYPNVNGPRGLDLDFPFTNLITQFSEKINLNSVGMEWVTGVFIDNSLNPQPMTLLIEETYQKFVVPRFSQGTFKVLGMRGDAVTFVGRTTGGITIPVMMLNFEVDTVVWNAVEAGAPNLPVSALTQPVSFSFPAPVAGISLAPNTAFVGLAANAVRSRLIINNPGTLAAQGTATLSPIYFRFGADPVIGPPAFELLPGGFWDSGSGICPTDSVIFMSPVINHRVAILEA